MPEVIESHTGRNLTMEAARVSAAGALGASKMMGRGDDQAADQAAVDAMHDALATVMIDGTIQFGEGEEDQAPKLYTGEKVGTGDGPKVDVALMPIEGPTIVAKGAPNALSIYTMTEEGGFLNVPDIYMNKIAIGSGLPDDLVSLDEEPAANLNALAKAKGVEVSDLLVCILDRPRHGELLAKVRETGARIRLIADGDVNGVIATNLPHSPVDIYLGIGGARQGVLSAAAMSCIGGHMQGKLVIRSGDDERQIKACGITDMSQTYGVHDMASGDVTFATTGITTGPMLRGIHKDLGVTISHSMVLRHRTGTLRYIESHHQFAQRVSDLG
jgi:fructose-1,6-bisphosphatase II / sedoheptulose-1,7-bisphosphatase